MPSTDGPDYPSIIQVYMQRCQKLSEPQYLLQFRRYSEKVLDDPLDGLNWKELLNWEHRHLLYTRCELPEPRAEMPIDIIKQARGRCREFALLYHGLLSANKYACRIIIDCSTLQDKSKVSAGDHVWNEILLKRGWSHVDPTERIIRRPLMYAQQWNKDVNLVYAVTAREMLDVTQSYKVQA